jgi:uncharacterized protein
VKLPDVNLFLYSLDSASHHLRARPWLEALLSGIERVGFAWSVLLEIVRLSTHPRLFANPLAPTEAFSVVEGWLGQPGAKLVHPT